MHDINGRTADVLEHAADLRRQLHRIPELGYQEFETAALIRGELDRLGIGFVTGPEDAATATVATVGSDPSKPCILFRADIDALPIRESSDKPYRSTRDGMMHACGHDGHAATLLATAAVLADEADELPVRVKLVWQPAEEGGGGGKRLCDAGLLDKTDRLGPKVAAAFALHGWPMLPVGTVSTRPGPLLAATDTFSLVFKGRGGHAAFPHLTADPIACAAGVVLDLQQFVSRELDPTEPAVLSVTQFHAGSANNVIPETATLAGTCRTLGSEPRRHAREAIERRARALASAGRCEVTFKWNKGYPPTINDPASADFVARVAREILGPDRFVPAARPAMGGEDFAYYLERVPGCFFLVGLLPPGRTDYPALHTERFDFTDAAIETGVAMFRGIARAFTAG